MTSAPPSASYPPDADADDDDADADAEDEDVILTEFMIDDDLMGLFQECMDHYGQGDTSKAEWPNNLLSHQLVIYGDGQISKRSMLPAASPAVVNHRVSSNELRLCQTVSKQLAARSSTVQEIGMGSEGGGRLEPFYMVSQLHEHDDDDDDDDNDNDNSIIPTEITEDLIRSKFANTIFPPTTMVIEPLQANGTLSWWQAVCEDGEGIDDYLPPWHAMIQAFSEHPKLRNPVFVQLGLSRDLWALKKSDYPAGTEMTGSVLPRMALGLTENGSIVGLFATVTHT